MLLISLIIGDVWSLRGAWYRKRIPDESNSFPPSLDTAKSTAPLSTASSGETHTTLLELINVAFAGGTAAEESPYRQTVDPSRKSYPVTVDAVPPFTGPRAGYILIVVGGESAAESVNIEPIRKIITAWNCPMNAILSLERP